MCGRAERRGLALIEVVLSISILAVALVPVLSMFGSSHRIGYNARRQVEVTMQVQRLLASLSELEESDFPPACRPGPAGPNYIAKLVMADGTPAPSGGSPAFQEVVDSFGAPPKDVARTLSLARQTTGELECVCAVEWLGIVGEKQTVRMITMQRYLSPRTWQRMP